MKGDIYRLIRNAKRKSQWTIAQRLGWNQSKISLIEAGIRSLSADEERKLLSALQKKD